MLGPGHIELGPLVIAWTHGRISIYVITSIWELGIEFLHYGRFYL